MHLSGSVCLSIYVRFYVSLCTSIGLSVCLCALVNLCARNSIGLCVCPWDRVRVYVGNGGVAVSVLRYKRDDPSSIAAHG